MFVKNVHEHRGESMNELEPRMEQGDGTTLDHKQFHYRIAGGGCGWTKDKMLGGLPAKRLFA